MPTNKSLSYCFQDPTTPIRTPITTLGRNHHRPYRSFTRVSRIQRYPYHRRLVFKMDDMRADACGVEIRRICTNPARSSGQGPRIPQTHHSRSRPSLRFEIHQGTCTTSWNRTKPFHSLSSPNRRTDRAYESNHRTVLAHIHQLPSR